MHFKEHKRSGRARFQKCCVNSRELLPVFGVRIQLLKRKRSSAPISHLYGYFQQDMDSRKILLESHVLCPLSGCLPNLQQSLLDVRGFLAREPTSIVVTVCFTQNSKKQQLYLVCFPVSPKCPNAKTRVVLINREAAPGNSVFNMKKQETDITMNEWGCVT